MSLSIVGKISGKALPVAAPWDSPQPVQERDLTLSFVSGNSRNGICLGHTGGEYLLWVAYSLLKSRALFQMDYFYPMIFDLVCMVCLVCFFSLARTFLFSFSGRDFSLSSPSVTASSEFSAFSFTDCADVLCISCFCSETETASHTIHSLSVSASFPFY